MDRIERAIEKSIGDEIIRRETQIWERRGHSESLPHPALSRRRELTLLALYLGAGTGVIGLGVLLLALLN